MKKIVNHNLYREIGRTPSATLDKLIILAKGGASVSAKQSVLASLIYVSVRSVQHAISRLIDHNLITSSVQEEGLRINIYTIHYDKVHALCPDFNKYVTKFGKGV